MSPQELQDVRMVVKAYSASCVCEDCFGPMLRGLNDYWAFSPSALAPVSSQDPLPQFGDLSADLVAFQQLPRGA